MTIRVFGDSISGNCLKVKFICDFLGISYVWEEVDILKGESRTAAFLALSPAEQVPVILLEDGRAIAQSNAIILSTSAEITGTPTRSRTQEKWMPMVSRP